MNRDENYTLVLFPESQQYMEEPWFDEEAILYQAIRDEQEDYGAAYFIPTKYILDFLIKFISDFENWGGAGSLTQEEVTHWVKKYFDVLYL